MTNPHKGIPALGLDFQEPNLRITSFSNSTTLRGRATLYLAGLSQGLVARDAKTSSVHQPAVHAIWTGSGVPTSYKTPFSTGPSLGFGDFFFCDAATCVSAKSPF